MASSTAIVVDFSNVKESSGINPKHQEEGDYLAKIVKVEMTKTKGKDGKKPEPMALIVFQDSNMRSAAYPYYCTFGDNMLWKIRNTFIAAGVPVPKGKGKIDLAKLVNKEVGITLEDDEYDGKMKSVISAVFHKDELEPSDEVAGDDDFEDDDEIEDTAPIEEEDDEEEEEEAPAPKKRKAKPAPVVEEEEDDVEEDDEEEEAPAPVKKKAKAKPAPVVEEDEDDEELDLDEL